MQPESRQWLDTVLRKNKNGATIAKTIKQQLQQQYSDNEMDSYNYQEDY